MGRRAQADCAAVAKLTHTHSLSSRRQTAGFCAMMAGQKTRDTSRKESLMAQHALVEIELPFAPGQFKLPAGVDSRLQELLTRQDRGETLTAKERQEAAGLVELAEMLSLLRLRAQRAGRERMAG